MRQHIANRTYSLSDVVLPVAVRREHFLFGASVVVENTKMKRLLVLCSAAAMLAATLSASGETLVAPITAPSASATYSTLVPSNAVDGNFGTMWSSGGFPNQWIILDTQAVRALSHIELLTAQYPNGATTHLIFTSNDLINWTLVNTLSGYTTNNQWLTSPINQTARYICIWTSVSPSWVGWYEFKVYEQSGSGIRQSAFIAENIPTVMTAGQTYNAFITMRNTGTDTWSAAALYRLGSQDPQDGFTWGSSRTTLPNNVGETVPVTFSFPITAPTFAGNYNFRRRMVQDNVAWFGSFTDNAVVQITSSPSYGFWDQGFTNPKVRTNYPSSSKGTSADPLVLVTPCLFSPCRALPTTYRQSNSFSQNLRTFSDAPFWTLINNNEPAEDNTCNSGPPDASLPRSSPGFGLFGFSTIMDTPAGEYFYRAHLVLNMTFPNPCGTGGIPYMSFGAHTNPGNGRIVGAINATSGIPHSVSFTTKLYGYVNTDTSQILTKLYYRLVSVSGWPDASGRFVPRTVQLNLLHEGSKDSCLLDRSNCGNGQKPGPGGPVFWAWPMAEDTFYPGSEVAYFDSEDVMSLCGFSVYRMRPADLGTNLNYDVDLQALFRCASDRGAFSNKMPSTSNLPITSVDWAVEGQSKNTSGVIWTAVHGMTMH
jgi:F5/8 type C domain